MSGDVVNIFDSSDDNRHWSPLQCVRECEAQLRNFEDDAGPTSIMIIMLTDREPQQYTISRLQSNINSSEMVSLLNITKHDILHEIRGDLS